MATNYNELVGTFGQFKDTKEKFVVVSYEGLEGSTHKYLIRWVGSNKHKKVSRNDILKNNVSSKIIKRNEIKNKKTSKVIKNGKDLKLLSLDGATEKTGFAFFDGPDLKDYGLWECYNQNKFKRIRYMAGKLEEYIIQNKINLVIVEDTYKKNNFIAFKTLTLNQGALIDVCERLEVKYHLVTATEWKGGLNILSSRNKGKNLAIDYIKKETGIIMQEDTAEATCIGIYTLRNLINWKTSTTHRL